MADANEMVSEKTEIVPFLKWAGGKRWLTEQSQGGVSSLGPIRGTYYEVFLGSGAMFFHLAPKKAVLNDINSELINTYKVIKSFPDEVACLLKRYHAQHSKEFYYKTRARRPADSVQAAVRFLYLNRTCWNGLYRVNLKGEFNVPIGTKANVVMPTDNFTVVAERLRSTSLYSKDFAAILAKAGDGDVVFADPPYTVNHNLNGFLKYNEQLFSWSDQERLHDASLAAIERGARVYISNADHSSIRKLYKEKAFQLQPVERYSSLSGSNAGRKLITELVISSR